MAREKKPQKPLELRPVEEEVLHEEQIIRLEKADAVVKVVQERMPVRPVPEARLEVPEVTAAEGKRSFEPGFEALIETEMAELANQERDWGQGEAVRNPLPWGWFALLGLVLAGAMLWAVTRAREGEEEVKKAREQAVATVSLAEATDQEIERSLALMDEAVRRYCTARSPSEMAPWVRQPERVRLLMSRYYGEHPFKPLGYQRQVGLQMVMPGVKGDFWQVKVDRGDGGKTEQLLVEQLPGDRYLVDWEMQVVYQPRSWDSYARERPRGTSLDFRVIVGEDHFFSHEFADAKRWSSYRLTAMDAEETLWGYAPRNSAIDAVIKRELAAIADAGGGSEARMLLRLVLPDGLKSRRGVIIDQVVSASWVMPDEADDGPK
jgi:hypothetical protein